MIDLTVEGWARLSHGMSRSQRRILCHELHRPSETPSNVTSVIPHDDDWGAVGKRRHVFDSVEEHRFAGHRVQHLGQPRTHSSPFSSSKYNGGPLWHMLNLTSS
ncbi:MAG: hypothetical protein Kow0047_16790 [Anaerolineae bacterium]